MAHTPPAPHGAELGALLELERALAERLQAAREDGDRLIQAGRDAAAQRELGLATELAASLRDLETRLASDRDRRIDEVTRQGQSRVQWLDALDRRAIDRAAAAVTEALIDAGASR